VLLFLIDGKVASAAKASPAAFGALPALRVGGDVCVGADPTTAFTGMVTNLCITSP
jgi:hypothetical protein